MVSKSAANRDRLVAGQWAYRRWRARPAGKVRPAGLAADLLAPVPPLAGERRRGRAQHVLGELPLAGQQRFRQLGPPGITAARHRAKPRFVIPHVTYFFLKIYEK